MVINLSDETINTIYNSLKCSKQILNKQLSNGRISSNKKEIIKCQLAEVEDALYMFEELMDNI